MLAELCIIGRLHVLVREEGLGNIEYVLLFGNVHICECKGRLVVFSCLETLQGLICFHDLFISSYSDKIIGIATFDSYKLIVCKLSI